MNDLKHKAAECGIPDYMIGGVVRYLQDRVEPGHFLCAVINNDLYEAFGRADDINMYCIKNYVQFFYNHAPISSWGRPGAVKDWVGENKKPQTPGEER